MMAEKPTHEEINQKEMLTKVSSAQWQTTFDAINDAVCLLDMNGKILRCNKAMESFLKKSSEEIIGGTCWKLVHGTDKPVKGCPIVRMKKTLCRETLVLKVDNKWLNVAVDPVIDETGNLTSAVHIISNITRRKQAEETQRESEEKYRALYDNAPLSYQALDENGCFIDVNPAWVRTIGYEKEEVIGKWFGNFLHPDWKPHFEKNFPEFKRRGYVHDVQFKIRHKDGHFLDISFEGSIGYHPDGSFKQTYCVFQDITERKQAEGALQESKEKYQSIFESANEAIFIIDIDGNIKDANHKASEIYGYFHDEFLTINARQLIRPDHFHIFIKHTQILLKQKYFQTEAINICKDGREIHVNVNATRMDYMGERCFLNCITDITERKQAEAELLLKDMVFEHSITANSISDNAGIITHINNTFIRLWGYESRNEAIGKPISDFLRFEDEAKKIITALDENGKWEGEYTALRKDGTTFSAYGLATIIPDESGDIIGYHSAVLDITDRKQAEAALRESEERLKTTLDSLQAGIVVIDAETHIIIDANPAAIRMIGAPEEHVIGHVCHDYICPAEKGKCPITDLGQKEDNSERILLTANREEVPILKTVTTMFLGGKRCLLDSFIDIGEKKKLEAQLAQSQKMEAIGMLAGGIAHDFNNLLTVIIGNAQLALMDVIKDESLRKEIEDIMKAGNKAASLTRQLLAFSRKQIVRPEILDINELLTDIEKMLGRLIGEDIELLTIPDPELWQVEIDPGQIEQVIMNLAVNARDAMPQGGKLTIETANVELNDTYFRDCGVESAPGHYVVLTVSDTGSGMDKETREHIFEPFFTTKEVGKGTGLGLSTVYGIAKQNNGFVWVYSEPGQGSIFKVYLPKVKGDAEPEEKEQSTVDDLGGSETVLIVEDDDVLRKLAQRVLHSHGYRVLDAENGEDALRVSKEHEGPIHLLLTDVVMPKMGGKKLAERLQPLYPQMKVIYMSGYTDNAIVHHGVLAPELNFIQKPFTLEDLGRKVRKALESEN
jgi:two-component system, cell cycle sensor histidine kinase and response regulator CckA